MINELTAVELKLHNKMQEDNERTYIVSATEYRYYNTFVQASSVEDAKNKVDALCRSEFAENEASRGWIITAIYNDEG